ncbi:MAG: hypothetical protein ABH878_03995, partial [bacterium]
MQTAIVPEIGPNQKRSSIWKRALLPVLSLWLAVILFLCPLAFAQPDPAAWVVNTLGETLSHVNLTTHQVNTNAVLLGSAPNDVAVQNGAAYVVNSLSNHVQVVDLASLQTIGTIEIYLGMNPYFIALDDQNRAFVTNFVTGNVSILDLSSGLESDTLQIGGVPEGVCVAGGCLFVTDVNYQTTWGPGVLHAFSLQTLVHLGSITVGINPQIVKLGPDGKLHVVCTGNFSDIFGQIDIIDPASLTVETSIPIGESPG